MAFHPGDIYICRAYRKPRPVIVVSRTELNQGGFVVIVPTTSRRLGVRAGLPNCTLLQKGESGLDEECVAQAEAITLMAVDQLDMETGLIGSLGRPARSRLVKAIGNVIAAECDPA